MSYMNRGLGKTVHQRFALPRAGVNRYAKAPGGEGPGEAGYLRQPQSPIQTALIAWAYPARLEDLA